MERSRMRRSQVEDKETEFPFDSFYEPVIIVVMGLPFTRTEMVAGLIGRWARCPILMMDDFLEFMSEEAGYNNGDSWLPSREEAERLNCRAIDNLCMVARQQLKSCYFTGFKCVVIKSPLICSTYELQRLLPVSYLKSHYHYNGRIPLILVECRLSNEYQWKQNFLHGNWGSTGKWYEARDWNEVEKAKEDYNYNAQDLDLHLLHQLIFDLNIPDPPPRVQRLVVDPYSDLNITWSCRLQLIPSLASAIKFLLTAGKQELDKEIPQTVEFRQLRRYLMEKKIAAAASAPQKRSKYCCVGGGCVFKYWETLTEDISCSCCGVCEKPLVVGEDAAAYSCYFCILTLHKSCAEMPHFPPPPTSYNALWSTFNYHIDRSPEKHACKSCTEAGQVFSYVDCESCRFQTHLKSRLIPTIILNPDFHDHMLSLWFPSPDYFNCKGCGWQSHHLDSSYGCRICETYYHPHCPFWPKEFKHEHGGHEHLMKLMLSHDGAEEEEDYWCDICYKDIDPQVWFYSCQHCPYYVAHLWCTLF